MTETQNERCGRLLAPTYRHAMWYTRWLMKHPDDYAGASEYADRQMDFDTTELRARQAARKAEINK